MWHVGRARICKLVPRNRFQGFDSASLCSLTGHYVKYGCRTGPHAENRFLGSLKGLQIRAQDGVPTKGVGRPSPTLAWPGWKQPDIPVEEDTDRLETSRREAGVLKKLSLAGIAKLSRLKYS